MKRPTKENHSHFSNANPTSTYRVEADQKDIIIRNLKNDCDAFRSNEAELSHLNDEYLQLQHSYRLLAEELSGEDRDFKLRHEAVVRNICQLKNQIDSLKMELRDKRLEINDLETDSNSLKDTFDERTIELDACRNDLKGCKADENELLREKQNLLEANEKLKQVIQEIKKEAGLLRADSDSVDKRLSELSKYHGQLIQQQKVLKEKILAYQSDNNQIDGDISNLCGKLNELQTSIREAQEELNSLQGTMGQIEAQNEKHKSEIAYVQKAIQTEVAKNNGLVKACRTAEHALKVRTGQVEQGITEVEGLKDELEGLNNINQKLEEDLLACRNHLQNLEFVNIKLVQNMQNFSEEDGNVRTIISRQEKVDYARSRVTEVGETNRYPGENTTRIQEVKSSRRTYR